MLTPKTFPISQPITSVLPSNHLTSTTQLTSSAISFVSGHISVPPSLIRIIFIDFFIASFYFPGIKFSHFSHPFSSSSQFSYMGFVFYVTFSPLLQILFFSILIDIYELVVMISSDNKAFQSNIPNKYMIL